MNRFMTYDEYCTESLNVDFDIIVDQLNKEF